MSGQQIGSVAGGVAGTYFGPVGTVVGAGIGGVIGGLFDSSPQAPTFADINLQTANPQLYAELMKESALADQATQLYNQRMQGPTYAERAQLADAQNNLAHQQVARGQLGSAVGMNQQSDIEQRLRSQLAAQAFAQQNQLLQQAQAAQSNYTRQYLGAQQAALDPLNKNYQNALQEQQSGNQFSSGLLQGGLSLYGSMSNADALQGIQAQNNPYPMQGSGYYGGGGQPYSFGSQYSPYGSAQLAPGYNAPIYGAQ